MLLVRKNVEYLCEKQGISIEDLFEKLDIDRVVYYSDSHYRKRKKFYAKIASYFNIDIEEL